MQALPDLGQERAGGHRNDHLIGGLPSQLLYGFKGKGLGAFRIVGADVDIHKRPSMFAGNFTAEPVHIVVVAFHFHDGRLVNQVAEYLCGFQIARDEDVAMQIAAMNPLAVDADSIPAEMVEREKAIALEQVAAEGKTGDMAEKIAMGKLNKFFKENTLLPQAFVKDGGKSVADYLKSVEADLTVVSFKRIAVGG